MSNPRSTVSFNEIAAQFVSAKSTGISASDIVAGAPGVAVTLVSDSTVGKGSAGNRLVGSVQVYQLDGIVSVQHEGFATFTYSGTAPAIGSSVECNGTGGVQVATSNDLQRDNTVWSVNSTLLTCVVEIH